MMEAGICLNETAAFDRAVDIFGSSEQAERWMRCEDAALQAAPATLVKTEDGLRQVMQRLRSIEIDLFVCA